MIDLFDHHTQYQRFTRVPNFGKQKTQQWLVLSHRGEVLGKVKWFGRWRQYTFHPAETTVFNNGCLGDIIVFIDAAMRDWRESKKS